MIQKNNTFYFLIAITIIFLISSCYTHEEGCKDSNATNFDVTVDEPCEDECCTYPKVKLNLNFMFNDSIQIDTNDYFTNNLGDSLRIRFLRVYFSEFILTNQENEELPIKQDIIIGKNEDERITYETINFSSTKIKPEGSNFTIGTLNKLLEYKNVKFNFGLNSTINNGVISKITSSSSLFPSTDSMYVDQEFGYYFLKLNIEIKNKTTKEIFVSGNENTKTLEIGGNFDFTNRGDHSLTLKMNLNKWFFDIDFINETENLIAIKLVNNLEGSITQ